MGKTIPDLQYREAFLRPESGVEFEDFIVACAEVSREPVRRSVDWAELGWRFGLGLAGFGLGLVCGAYGGAHWGLRQVPPAAGSLLDPLTTARMDDHNVRGRDLSRT